MSTNFSKKLSIFIFLILFASGLFCTNQNYNVKAATASSVSTSSNGKLAATKSETQKASSSNSKGNSKSNSKENSSQSESLLPSDGNSLPPAAEQNWDQIMSDINKTADKDEFSFTEEPAHLGFFGSKLSYIGFGLILISILGFTYFIFSAFLGKKSTRKLKRLSANSSKLSKNFSNKISNKNYNQVRQIPQRKTAQNSKSIYSDGYGYTRAPQQIKQVKKKPLQDTDSTPKNNVQKPKIQSNHSNLNSTNNSQKAKHMLDDDNSNVIMSNDDSIKSNNIKPSRITDHKRNNKKDEFWNDFFLN